MRPLRLGPSPVAPARVRRLSGGVEAGTPVQRLTVPVVPVPRAVPRQVDPLDRRLSALQLENERLRAELDQLHAAS